MQGHIEKHHLGGVPHPGHLNTPRPRLNRNHVLSKQYPPRTERHHLCTIHPRGHIHTHRVLLQIGLGTRQINLQRSPIAPVNGKVRHLRCAILKHDLDLTVCMGLGRVPGPLKPLHLPRRQAPLIPRKGPSPNHAVHDHSLHRPGRRHQQARLLPGPWRRHKTKPQISRVRQTQ